MISGSTTEMVNLIKDRICCWAKNNGYPKDEEDIFYGLVDMIGRVSRIRKRMKRMHFPLVDKPEKVCVDLLVYVFRYSDLIHSNLGDALETLLHKTNKQLDHPTEPTLPTKKDSLDWLEEKKDDIIKKVKKDKSKKLKSGWYGKPTKCDRGFGKIKK